MKPVRAGVGQLTGNPRAGTLAAPTEGGCVLLRLDVDEPEHWLVAEVVKVLKKGNLVVVPTDTVYGVACDVTSEAAAEKLYRLKAMNHKKLLSILCCDLEMACQYTKGIPNTLFKILRRKLPGPYTFILPASKELPRVMRKDRKTVGIRIPACPITLAIVEQLGNPLLSTSLAVSPGCWLLDPEEIEEEMRGVVDMVVDGGHLFPEPSTVIDFTGSEPELVREGKGPVDFL